MENSALVVMSVTIAICFDHLSLSMSYILSPGINLTGLSGTLLEFLVTPKEIFWAPIFSERKRTNFFLSFSLFFCVRLFSSKKLSHE